MHHTLTILTALLLAGTVFLNIGLLADGSLPESQDAYLKAIRSLTEVNGEGIYGSRPWTTYGEGPLQIKTGRQGENRQPYSQKDIRFTQKGGNLYTFLLAPPCEDILIKTLATDGLLKWEIQSVALLRSNETVKWSRSPDGLAIQRPASLPGPYVAGFRLSHK